MAKQLARISRNGGDPEVEIRFGDANLGVYRIYRWRSERQPEEIRAGTLGPVVELEGSKISYEAIIQSPLTGADQPYAMFLEIRQDGEAVPGGSITESGKLNSGGAKSVSGLISFELS